MIRTLLIFALMSNAAIAQTIYRPVQFEYGQGDSKFYYGGSNPTVIARAERSLAARIGSACRPIMTFSDALPFQPNAALYGYSANDAKNDAYQSQPRYFANGGRTTSVPATVFACGPGTIEVKPFIKPTGRMARW